MVKRILGNYKRRFLNLVERPAVVLLYHRVTHLNKDPQLLSVSPENFYAQINLLKKKFNVLEIEEFSEILIRRKRFPANSIMLTFDDGYADNLLEAVPILESLEAQAIFYITTSNLNTSKELWWDGLERILYENKALPSSIEFKHNNALFQYPLGTDHDKEKTYASVHHLLKYAIPTERDHLINQLQKLTNAEPAGRETHRLLTRNELVKMSFSKAAIMGAHTHNHPALSVLDYEDQFNEIKTSKDILENTFNKKVVHFSYPYGGKKDYNKNSIRACQELEFKMVCSNHYGQAHSWTNPFRIPRVLVRNWDEKKFGENIANAFNS